MTNLNSNVNTETSILDDVFSIHDAVSMVDQDIANQMMNTIKAIAECLESIQQGIEQRRLQRLSA